ncbi:MAG: hypothetical protein HOD90_10235 [Nitrospina sp.]|jgi:hypothetical protein|nr:hypothetical protein [Bacteriovoracaceae bacterium]MBT4260272.1 hypothetical protein [Nitrospina sp.]
MAGRIPSFKKGIYRAIPLFESDQKEMSSSELWHRIKLTPLMIHKFDSLGLTPEDYEDIYPKLNRKGYFVEAEWLRKYRDVRIKREEGPRIV